MGIHFPSDAGQVSLTVNVIGTHGTVTPMSGMFNKYTVVVLTAAADPGYRVRWTGTDDDTSAALVNTVMMNSDKTVTAIIEQPRVLRVPSDFPRIQLAIDASEDGDTIVINEGTYRAENLVIAGKAITLTGTNPDDPCSVAVTILDGTGYTGRGLSISSSCGPDTVINGLTTISHYSWDRVPQLPPPYPGNDGYFGADIWGGGIYVASGASPTIVNCRIVDCNVTAGDASSGVAGATAAVHTAAGYTAMFTAGRRLPAVRFCVASRSVPTPVMPVRAGTRSLAPTG